MRPRTPHALLPLLALTLVSCQQLSLTPGAAATAPTPSQTPTASPLRPGTHEARISAPIAWDLRHRTKECAEQPFKFTPDGVPMGTIWIAIGNNGGTEIKKALTVLDIPVPTLECRDLQGLNGEFTLYDAQGNALATHRTVVQERVLAARSNRYITTSPPVSDDTFDKAERVEFRLTGNFREPR